MSNSTFYDLEPEQLKLLKTLAQANENVPAEKRSVIRGVRADGVLNLSHPGFPEGRLVPNDFDLQQLNVLGLISAYDQGGRKGWVVDVLPEGKRYLASFDYGTQASDVEARGTPVSAELSSPQQGPGDPKIEAVQILERVIQDVEAGNSPLDNVLRRCAKSARLTGETESAELFTKEIIGYFDSEEPPYYRRIRGTVLWRTIGIDQLNDPTDTAAKLASKLHGNPQCELLARSGIAGLGTASTDGYWQLSKDIPNQSVPEAKSWLGTLVEAVEYYPPQVFSACLKAIEQVIYDWAVQWSVYLRYESRVTSIWQRYRSSVDGKLEEISLTNHLKSIDQNLASANEQDWRNVLYGCRSVLQDVANYLWRDDRGTYLPIQVRGDDGKKGPMRVTQSDYVNRIQAYLHQKSTKGADTELIETEAEYLAALFVRLNRMDNRAHVGATKELAESAPIQTYVILAELIRRTDMKPVERYEE